MEPNALVTLVLHVFDFFQTGETRILGVCDKKLFTSANVLVILENVLKIKQIITFPQTC